MLLWCARALSVSSTDGASVWAARKLRLAALSRGDKWTVLGPGAVQTSPPSTELPPFPAPECCRIALLRLVAFAGLILAFQLAAKAPLKSCPGLLLINLSFDMGWNVNQSTEKSSGFGG